MKLYIAGPMSGIPKFNFPAFLEAGKMIRDLGYETINPAELDLEEDSTSALSSEDGKFEEDGTTAGKTWGDFLMRDVKIVADKCDGVALLPGWENSRGARLEAFIAINVGKPVYYCLGKSLVEADPLILMAEIGGNTINQGDVSRYGENK